MVLTEGNFCGSVGCFLWYRVSVSKGAYERLRGKIAQNLNLLSKTASRTYLCNLPMQS
mgnify:CR=1 FL=1